MASHQKQTNLHYNKHIRPQTFCIHDLFVKRQDIFKKAQMLRSSLKIVRTLSHQQAFDSGYYLIPLPGLEDYLAPIRPKMVKLVLPVILKVWEEIIV